MACDCIKKVDELLKPHNTVLSTTYVFGTDEVSGGEFVTIKTEIIAPKRGERPKVMFPTYCPFCGTRYRAPEVAA